MEIIEINESHRDYVTSIIKIRWDVSYEESQHEFNRWLNHDKDSICYVGLIDGVPMATGAFDTEIDTTLKISPYNTLLWVELKHRGNGYGKMLSEIRYKYALEHSYKIIYLDTVNAYKYHLKFGWKLERTFFYNNENYSTMYKVLDDELSFNQTRNIHDYSQVLKPLAEDFTAIFYQTMLVWCNIIPSDKAQSDKLWEVWLINLGNKQIGVCGLYTLHGVTDTKELWLSWLGIIPELRNLKLGVQVMEHLYSFAKSVGCERIYSYVDKDGKPLNFYNREGFNVIGTVGEYCEKNCLGNIDGDDFEDKDDYVIMKQLNTTERHKTIKMNGVNIDEGISDLIQQLWDNGIETIQCCQGGYIVDKETIFTHLENDKIVDNAHIIFYLRDIDKIKQFLPSTTEYIIGDKTRSGHIAEWLGSFNGVWANMLQYDGKGESRNK